MKNCPYCAHRNREGYLFCEECGHRLFGEGVTNILTKRFETNTTQFARPTTWGTARFAEQATIVLHVRDANDPIMLEPQQRTILGRLDVSAYQKPDLDLTPFGALEKGVSRIHAAIFRSDETLTLVDMNSANGTHLNGQRLIPHQPRVLRDGDEIQFGKMVAHIYFKANRAAL